MISRLLVAHTISRVAAMGDIVPAPVKLRFKFASEDAHVVVPVPPPATPANAIAAVLSARADVTTMLRETYPGFALELCDPATGRPFPAETPAFADDAEVHGVLTKAYAVRAFAPVRRYVVGRFAGAKPPKFKSGKAAPVDWQLRTVTSDVETAFPPLALANGGKQKSVFTGAREAGQTGNFYLLMMQANTSDVCAVPLERWYNFRADASRRVLTLEEAEDQIEAAGKRATNASKWLEAHTGGGGDDDDGLSDSGSRDVKAAVSSDDDDDNDYDSKRKRKKKAAAGDDDDEKKDAANAENAPGARGIAKVEGDDWEHDEGASDDEGAGEADELEMEEPPPPPPPRLAHDSDDDGDDELDDEGKEMRRLLGKQEDGTIMRGLGGSAEGLGGMNGGLSDSDSDSEFVDPDQEELHPFLLQQQNKLQARAAEMAKQEAEAMARATAASEAAAAAAAVKQEPTAAGAGIKRARSDDDVAARPGKAAKTEREPAAVAAAYPPIEAALRELLRRGAKPTTKDVTKQLRKRGLLNTDADKNELKATISRIARIRKEGEKSFVVLL